MQVLVVSFSPLEQVAQVAREMDLPFPVLLDHDRRVYEQYGLGRARLAQFLNPALLWKYLRLVLQGNHPERPQSDPMQLGGDFVVDKSGVLRFTHRSADPGDRPTIDGLSNLAQALSRAR